MHSGIEMYMKELFNDSAAFGVMTPITSLYIVIATH